MRKLVIPFKGFLGISWNNLPVEDAGCGDVTTPQDPQALASLWRALAADRSRLDVTGGRRWLADHADAEVMTDRYESLLRQVSR